MATITHEPSSAHLLLCIVLVAGFASADEPARAAPRDTFESRPWTWQPDALTLARRATAADATFEEAVEQCVTDDMARFNTPGAAVAVAVDGALVYRHGYGVKSLTGGQPVDGDTVFRIGSITKQLTAVAVLQQVEAGAVDLDEPVTRAIPELHVSGQWTADQITVRHLITHTSGFPDLPLQANGATDDGALSRWAAGQNAFGLHAPPGSFFNYSNPNFMLAGLVVERASGIPYHQYMPERVFDPAGLTATTLDPSKVVAGGNYSWGHARNSAGNLVMVGPTTYDNWAAAPAGWAFSTAPDLVRWALLLMDGGGTVLAPGSVAELQRPRVLSYFGPTARYGYGLFVDDVAGIRLVYHGGNITGFGAFVLWAPDHGFAVAVLANGPESLMDAAGCVAAAVLPFSDGPSPDVTTDPATWRRYTGTYEAHDTLGEAFTAVVNHDGAHLRITFRIPGEPAYTTEMYQYFYDTFIIDGDGDERIDTDVTFVSGAGEPSRVMWLRNRYAVGSRTLETRGTTGRRSP